MKRGLTAHISRPLTARLPTSTRNNGFKFGDNKGRISRKCPFNGKCTDQSNLCQWCKFTKKCREIYDKGKKLLEESERNPQLHIAYHGRGAKF